MTLSERLVVLKNALSSYLKSIKQALTNKNVNINGNLKYRDIAAYIDAIKLGDDTSDATATSSDIREGTKAWVKGELIDGSMPDTSVSIDENVVEIKTAGYIENQTHVVGIALPATEYTPGKENIHINKGRYLTGQQTIFGDANLLPENIKKGTTIFNIEGNYLFDFQNATTATSSDIAQNVKVYDKNGNLIEGTLEHIEAVVDKNVISIPAGIINETMIQVGTLKSITSPITPGTKAYTIAADTYLDYQVIIEGDANLIASNIKSGVNIFGVTGSYGGDITISDPIIKYKPDINDISIEIYTTDGTLIYDRLIGGLDQIAIPIARGSEITPSSNDITIRKHQWIEHEDFVIKGDANLVADNIKEGVSIFGITGTCKNLDVSLSTVTQNSMLKGTKAYDSTGTLIDGLIDIAADPNISINYNSSTGKIVGSVTEYTGYIENDREYKSGINPSDILPTTYTTEITPSPSKQTITKNQWIATDITINGDNQLKPENIKKDITIFNITGTYTGEYEELSMWLPHTAYYDETLPGLNLLAELTPGYVKWNENNFHTYHLPLSAIMDGIPNLKSENIKKDITIYGVTGSYEGDSFDFSSATVTGDSMLSGVKAWNSSGELVTGTISTSTPTVSGNTVTIPKGYIPSTTTKTVGTALSARTYTPGRSNQTIDSGNYLTGTQTILGDANLIAENIKKDITIFNITGTYIGKDSGLAVWDDTVIAIFDSYLNKFEITPSVGYGFIGPENCAYTYYIEPERFIHDIPNLLSENIKNGISILGVVGTYTGESGELSTWQPHATHYDESIPGLCLTAELTAGCIKQNENNHHTYNISLNSIIGGIPNLDPENIKSGVTIFGITGTYEGENSGQQPNVVQYPIPKYDEKYYLVYTFMPSSETFGYDLVTWDILEGRDIPANAFTSSGSPLGSMKQIVVDGPYDTFNDINTAIEGKSYRAECTIIKNQ